MANFTVTMPDIGEGVVEGEVIEWLKKEGDPVAQDEPVVIVMTDKATVELPSPRPGILLKQHYQPGQMAVRDKPLYTLQVEGEEPTSVTGIETPKSIPQPPRIERQVSEGILATPFVRKKARDLKIPLEQVQGTGKEGRVTEEDLHAFSARPNALPEMRSLEMYSLPGDERVPLVGIAGLMAKSMERSHREIPPFSYFEQVDVTLLIQLREKLLPEAEKEHIRLSFMPFLIRALSLTLRQYPLVNSSLDFNSKAIIRHQAHNIGIAFSSPNGLIVPVLKNVQELSFRETVLGYEALKQKAALGKLLGTDMKEGTMTLSNFGAFGSKGLWATPIINPPESAILAVAKIHKQPFVKNGAVAAVDVLNLSWTFDHRLIDGGLAAQVSNFFANLLKNPTSLT